MQETESKQSKLNSLSFEDIVAFLKCHFFSLLVIAFLGGVIGVLTSYLFPKTFKATISLLPEYGSAQRSSFAMLAAGISGDGAEKLLPDLYPNILQSKPFGLYILQQPVTTQENKKYKTLQSFLESTAKPILLSSLFPSKPKAQKEKIALKDPNILNLSAEENARIKHAISLVTSAVDQKAGLISISSETEDPYISTILVESAKNYLVNYVEDYRVTKAKERVVILRNQMDGAKARFRRAEVSLQSYRDNNRNAYMNVARIGEQRLQSEYLLSESLFNSLNSQYEQALLKVDQEKPVFKVLEPATVPLDKAGPKRLRWFLIAAFLVGFITVGYILLVKNNINKPLFKLPFFN